MNQKSIEVIVVLVFGIILTMVSPVSGSETRTVELFPVADSFVYKKSPTSNYGRELYLFTEYEDQRTIITAYTFEVPPDSQWIKVSLPRNGKIIGSFDVIDGGNRDINFRIRSEDGTMTFLQKTQITSFQFTFVAPYTGDFYLQFDNSFSWFTSKIVALSDVILTMDPFGVISSPIFLLFDLSSIPPEATINSAILSMTLEGIGSEQSIVHTFSCSNHDWTELALTYENAPFSAISYPSSSLDLSGLSSGDRCEWNIKADIVRDLTTGKLTEVLAIVDSENESYVNFYPRETEHKPKIQITYTFVSVDLSVSPGIVGTGQNVAIRVSTDPPQTKGTFIIQYSTDQILWKDITTFSGGAKTYTWTPSTSGLIYVRAVWQVLWADSGYASSKTVSLNVDATKPEIMVITPWENAILRSYNAKISWSGSDAVSGVDYFAIKIDDKPWIDTGLATAYTFTKLSDGIHTVLVKVVDNVGLSNEESLNFIVNTSLIGGPGWTDDIAVVGLVIIAAVITTYFLTEKKLKEFPVQTRHQLFSYLSIFVMLSGIIILAFVGWLTWYDITWWGKDVATIFFGSRTGEAISLSIGFKVIYYFLIGLGLLLFGLIMFFRTRQLSGKTVS